MINDVIYDELNMATHAFEGFPTIKNLHNPWSNVINMNSNTGAEGETGNHDNTIAINLLTGSEGNSIGVGEPAFFYYSPTTAGGSGLFVPTTCGAMNTGKYING